MWLKRVQEITTDDLPYIEAANFAVFEVKSKYRQSFSAIGNLDSMLEDSGRPPVASGAAERREWLMDRLVKRIESHDVLLVRDRHHPPLAPPFKWQADAAHAQGGRFQVAHPHAAGQSRLEGLLHGVRPSHQSLVQTARAAALAAAAGTAGVKAIQALTDEKRYPLIMALSYNPPQSARADKVLSARFKWENETTGPESRSSGQIKPSDPAFSELRCRELRAGDYTLAFQKSPRAVRCLEPKK